MSAVVASLPAPAVTAPHAILLTPADASSSSARGKLFLHPFFPLLHLMHFPHLFLGAGLGGHHHHHGLGGGGGFHPGFGGGFHPGFGGGLYPGLGYGHFPFRALPPEPTRSAQPTGAAAGGHVEASAPTTTAPPTPSTARTEPPASGPPGSTHLAPLPQHVAQPLPPAQHYKPPPPFKAFITPKRKVVPVYPVSAYPLPAPLPPPLPAYATYDGPLRLTAPSAAAESDIHSNLVFAPVGGLPAASYAPAAPPQAAHGNQYIKALPSSAPSVSTLWASASSASAPSPASAPSGAPAPQHDSVPPCECPEEDRAAVDARVELDHSVTHTSEKPAAAPSPPGPLAPPPTVAPGGQPDSSPEVPQRREKDDDQDEHGANDAEAETAEPPSSGLEEQRESGRPSDSRVLIVVGEQPAATATEQVLAATAAELAPADTADQPSDPDAATETYPEADEQTTEEDTTTTEFATTVASD